MTITQHMFAVSSLLIFVNCIDPKRNRPRNNNFHLQLRALLCDLQENLRGFLFSFLNLNVSNKSIVCSYDYYCPCRDEKKSELKQSLKVRKSRFRANGMYGLITNDGKV